MIEKQLRENGFIPHVFRRGKEVVGEPTYLSTMGDIKCRWRHPDGRWCDIGLNESGHGPSIIAPRPHNTSDAQAVALIQACQEHDRFDMVMSWPQLPLMWIE